MFCSEKGLSLLVMWNIYLFILKINLQLLTEVFMTLTSKLR